MSGQTTDGSPNSLKPYLSPFAVWTLSVGSAIGWGSLIVTSSTYISQAGPLGSILGLLAGFLLMIIVAANYHFLANRHPGTGGLYNYVKYIFGYDRAFLAGWFLFLEYIAIFWANATSIPLFARYFLHGAFRFGYLYTIFGYEVYLGEALVTLAVIALVGFLCMKSKKATARSMEMMVLVFTVGITACFIIAMVRHGGSGMTMAPAFVPDGGSLRQVVRIAFVSPWAFIGFESVSHSASEYKFRHDRMFRILLLSLVVITALYIFLILLSTSAYPEGCTGWMDYISRLDEFSGIEAVPAFYAANRYLGPVGVYIMMASLLSLVLTSMVGMLRALSRLCYSVAQDGILPERFSRLSDNQIPANTILLVLLVSLPIPFIGRTAIGWIVDTTVIVATIVYGFASAAVFKASGQDGSVRHRILSGICLVILAVFLLFLLFPGLFSDHTIGTETYFLMTVWSLLGLVFFHYVIWRDHARNFGKAIIVWIALLAFIVLMTMTWVERSNEAREDAIVEDIMMYYDGTADPETLALGPGEFMDVQRNRLHAGDSTSVTIITGLFGLSLVVLFVNYISMRKWEKKATAERDEARDAAFRDPLTGVKSKHAFAVQEGILETRIVEDEAGEFAITVCDVNGLKKINDTKGHKAGDDYIRAASAMLCEYFKHSPVFRIGGDEFVVLLQGHDYEERHEILADINSLIDSNVGTDRVVISIGMTEFDPENDESFHQVFARADGLMYERKLQLKEMGAETRD